MTIKKLLSLAVLIAVSIVILFISRSPVDTPIAFKESDLPPRLDLSTLKLDKSWTKEYVGAGEQDWWCSDNFILFHHHGRYFIKNRLTGKTKKLPRSKIGRYEIAGCTPDAEYIFLINDFIGKDEGKETSMDILHRESMRIVKSLPMTDIFSYISFISPNGKFMAWFAGGEVVLDKEHKIKFVPMLTVLNIWRGSPVWSVDYEYVYLERYQSFRKRPRIFKYKITGRKVKEVAIDSPYPGTMLSTGSMKPTPDGTGVYFIAKVNDHESGRYISKDLYRINFKDFRWFHSSVKAELVLRDIWNFDSNQDGDIIFTTSGGGSKPSGKGHGIYLLEKKSGKIKKLTENESDHSLSFSKSGTEVMFSRVAGYKGEVPVRHIYILKKKQ